MTHEERIQYIRIILGNPPIDVISDVTIGLFLTRWETYFEIAVKPDNEPYVLYNTVISCLQWLIASATSSGSIYTSRSEKIGDESIDVRGNISQLQAWKDLLDYIEDNPDYVDITLKNGLENLIVIGGVRKDLFNDVKKNPNSLGPFDEQGVVKSTQNILSPENGLVYRNWPYGG